MLKLATGPRTKYRSDEAFREFLEDNLGHDADVFERPQDEEAIFERYVQAEFWMHLHIRGWGIDADCDRGDWCAVLQRAGEDLDAVDRVSSLAKLDLELRPGADAECCVQDAMLVLVRKNSEDGQGMDAGFVPTAIRLRRLDHCPFVDRQHLEPPAVFASSVRPVVEDVPVHGVLRQRDLAPGAVGREFMDEVFEDTAEVVDGFANDQPEEVRWLPEDSYAGEYYAALRGLRVELVKGRVRLCFEELDDFRVEGVEIFLRPRELRFGSKQLFRDHALTSSHAA